MHYHIAYIGIGTNIEPRMERMREAIDALKAGWTVMAESGIYETSPVGFAAQADFLNAVVAVSTLEAPHVLHQKLKALEQELGRQQRERWHEREIDFDILFYDNFIIADTDLTIPHPELHKRLFVIAPLAEIAADLVHPVLQQSIQSIRTALTESDQDIRRLTDG